MLCFLQISVSILFFLNKVLILIGRKSGWLFGITAASLAVFYFYMIGLYVYTVLEFGLIILMGYGFFKKEKRSKLVEKVIQISTIVTMFLLAIFAFSGLLTIVELGSSLGLLAGTFFLTHNKIRLGWVLNGLAHILAAILGASKGQQFFVALQIASVFVSIVGVMMKKK